MIAELEAEKRKLAALAMHTVKQREAELEEEKRKVIQQAQAAHLQAAMIQSESQKWAQQAELDRQKLAQITHQVRCSSESHKTYQIRKSRSSMKRSKD